VRAPRFGVARQRCHWLRNSVLPRLTVQSHKLIKATPEQGWAVVRDFCAPWHPAIERMAAQRSVRGGLVRRFEVSGEETIYRERLTYFSDSERVMAYRHLDGIAGVDHYDARVVIAPATEGASVTMRADFFAPAPRAHEIAEGTQVIFDTGTKAIAAQASTASPWSLAETSPATVAIQIVEIDSLPRLALSTAGGSGDTLCLFLHGIGGNRTNWDQQLAAVAGHCPVAALDLRGYGDSSLGAAQSTVEDYCADILRVMDVRGAKRLILCGLSYGAWIATTFAMRHPEKLAALILSGGCTGMSEAGPDEREAFRLSREVPMNEGQTPADFAPSVVEVIAGPKASAEDRATLHAAMAAIPTETYADALRCFTNPLETFDFAKLTMPVLLITGEHDRLAPPAEIKRVSERIWDASPEPDVRFEVISGAGHVCNIEKPGAYNSILTEFLARVLP